MSKALEILHNYWGYSDFRPPQEAIIKSLLEGKQVVAVLPTGAGKSLCYQVPAMALPGICIVVSPLIALMKDQVEGLKKRGLRAISLSSALSQHEIIQLFDNLKYGDYKFLYLSPERLQSEMVQEQLRSLSISLIAVDEAHCISEWGHDFRPSYRKIVQLRKLHPEAAVIATTATATSTVIEDIEKNLELNNCVHFRESLYRPELSYGVKKVDDLRGELKLLLRKYGSPAIIYTSSRKACLSIRNDLNADNLPATLYHGGLETAEREQAYQHWLSEQKPYMVATNAFGMGIDKNNVRSIIHAQLPFSLENYLQESGRAGRDGSLATAYLLYNESSIHNFKTQTDASLIALKELKNIYKILSQTYQIAPGECPTEVFGFDLSEFCDRYSLNQVRTHHALKVLEQEGVIQLSENTHRKSTIKISCSQELLFNYLEQGSEVKTIMNHLLRTYGGLFDHAIAIDEYVIAKRTEISKVHILTRLQQMANDHIIEYRPVIGNQSVQFLVPREDDITIHRISKHVDQRNRIKLQKQQAVIEYIENTTVCRVKLLLEYFNQTLDKDCGHCDICLNANITVKRINYREISERILEELRVTALSSNELLTQLNIDKSILIESLELLLEKNKISLTSQNKFQVN